MFVAHPSPSFCFDLEHHWAVIWILSRTNLETKAFSFQVIPIGQEIVVEVGR